MERRSQRSTIHPVGSPPTGLSLCPGAFLQSKSSPHCYHKADYPWPHTPFSLFLCPASFIRACEIVFKSHFRQHPATFLRDASPTQVKAWGGKWFAFQPAHSEQHLAAPMPGVSTVRGTCLPVSSTRVSAHELTFPTTSLDFSKISIMLLLIRNIFQLLKSPDILKGLAQPGALKQFSEGGAMTEETGIAKPSLHTAWPGLPSSSPGSRELATDPQSGSHS